MRELVIRPAEPADVALLLELFHDLAVYEHIEHELHATPELLARALFGERPVVEALIATRGREAAGYAMFFTTFSSFRCREGVWLEDLFVRPAHRRAGVGRALLAAVAARVLAREGARFEWSALAPTARRESRVQQTPVAYLWRRSVGRLVRLWPRTGSLHGA